MPVAARLAVPALLATMGSACIEVPPAPEELDAAHDSERLELGFEHVPAGARPRRPAEAVPPPPVSAGSADDRPRIRVSTDNGDICRWSLVADGLPAIADDGTVATVTTRHYQMSVVPGEMELVVLEPDGGASRTTHEIAYRDGDPEECAATVRRLRRFARGANRQLDGHAWRTMDRIPVQSWGPGESRAEYTEALAPRERPVQVAWVHGELVARRLGIEVLERHSARGGVIEGVYADAATGTVVVVDASCSDESCSCDPTFSSSIHRWSATTLEAVARHPCNLEDGNADSCTAAAEWNELFFDAFAV